MVLQVIQCVNLAIRHDSEGAYQQKRLQRCVGHLKTIPWVNMRGTCVDVNVLVMHTRALHVYVNVPVANVWTLHLKVGNNILNVRALVFLREVK